MQFPATYAGTVEAVDNDPERIGRVKVRVPAVYGPAGATENSIPLASLPWAMPAGLPAGGTQASGAIQWLPSVGDHVYVRFLDGEPEKPIWEWGCQDRGQAASFPYWRRRPGGYGADGSAPDSAALLRHGHIFELSPQGLMAATSRGYALVLTDATDSGFGLAQLLTAKGYQVTIDDNEDQMTIYVPSLQALVETAVFTGARCAFAMSELFRVSTANAEVEAGQAKVTTTGATAIKAGTEVTAVAPRVALGTAETQDPVVRLSDLTALADDIMAKFNAHLHVGNLGRPTSPPTQPMLLSPTGSEISFSA